MNLGVHSSRFLHRVLHPFDVGDLRANMEMEQLEILFFFVFSQQSNALDDF